MVEQEKDMVRERANQIKMQTTERVRELNSALQYAKVLKEREEQHDIQQAKQEYEDYIEQKHHEQLMNDLESENKKACQKNYTKLMNSKVNAQVVKEQVVHESKRKKLETKITSNQDKEILRLAMEEMHREKQKEDERRSKKVKLAQETIEANRKLQKELKKKAKLEKEEEERIEQWNKQQEKKRAEFEKKIADKQKEVQRIRQKMIDRQVEYLSNLQNKEAVRLENQIKQKEEQAIKEFKRKQERKAEMRSAVKTYNDKMVEHKQAKHIELKETDKMYANQIRMINQEIAQLEIEEEEEEKARNKQLQKYLIKQVEYKNALKMKEVDEEREVYLTQQSLLRKEDEDFKSYAEK